MEFGICFSGRVGAVIADHQDDRPMLWDVRRAACLATLPHDVDFLEEVSCSQDGPTLAWADVGAM